MRRRTKLGVAIALTVAIGMFGFVDTLQATPKESQRLRGLGDRLFLVHVTLTENRIPESFPFPVGTTFLNCYIFTADTDADGNNWFETAFPETVGFWAQDTNGAKTSYHVEAGAVLQDGWVTPARGKGVLQLEAISTVGPVLEFLSVGEEIDESEMEAKCPTLFDPTFPPEPA